MYIDNTLYRGRPAGERIPKETRCYDFLDRLSVEYFRVDHEHADTIPDCELVEELLGCKICKNLFLTNRQQTDFYLLIMPGEKPFKTKLLSKQIGSARLSFAGPEHMEQYLDITPGSLSILGLMNDPDQRVRLVIDRPVLDRPEIGFHPCLNTSTLAVSTGDLTGAIIPALRHLPTVVELPEEAPQSGADEN